MDEPLSVVEALWSRDTLQDVVLMAFDSLCDSDDGRDKLDVDENFEGSGDMERVADCDFVAVAMEVWVREAAESVSGRDIDVDGVPVTSACDIDVVSDGLICV